MGTSRASELHGSKLVRLLFLWVTSVALAANLAHAGNGQVVVLTVADAIGPATQDYIARSFEQAAVDNADLIVIRMDTPGGLDGAMRDIIKTITTSAIPVVTYVSPTGARAASAGTYILYASHVAAMAPGTNLGAATPVQIGGLSFPGGDKPKTDNKQDRNDGTDSNAKDEEKPVIDPGDAMKHKMVNDASAYIRSLAELHGRNGDWAEKAVREAASLQASEALSMNVVDIVTSDIDDLLQQIDGREVLVQGQTRTLHTQGLVQVDLSPDWRNRLLSVITNPNVAYILMMVGVYGLILEFYNPGGLVSGTVGAICLVLALYSFQLLPVNYAGFALVLLGVALMVAEAFQPSFGMLGIGGVVAFVIGSIILMDTDIPDFKIYLSVVATFAVTTVLILFLVIGMVLRARNRPVVSGVEELIGKVATVTVALEANYANVRVHSELWRARAQTPLYPGQEVRVTAVDGLTLEVEPLPEADLAPGNPDTSLAEQSS
jgi:membrane-bound serine protease (ClpP class)